MRIVEESISLDELTRMAEVGFGEMVKGVVDVRRRVLALDAELHSDEEAALLGTGSRQEDLWGINLYPADFGGPEFIEFDSMINIRPSNGNRSRGVDDPAIRERIREIVGEMVKP